MQGTYFPIPKICFLVEKLDGFPLVQALRGLAGIMCVNGRRANKVPNFSPISKPITKSPSFKEVVAVN